MHYSGALKSARMTGENQLKIIETLFAGLMRLPLFGMFFSIWLSRPAA